MRGINVLPSSWKVYANHVQGFTGITDESLLNQEEIKGLIAITVPGIKGGASGINYSGKSKHNTGFGVKGIKVGYGTKVNLQPSIRETLQFTLGKADIVMYNGKVMVVDEYDMPMDKGVLKKMGTTEEKLRNGSILDKFEYILGAKGSQGKAHRWGELFAAKEGESLSQRYTLGTLKELGLTEEDVAHLQSLEQYEKSKLSKGKMNPKNKITS